MNIRTILTYMFTDYREKRIKNKYQYIDISIHEHILIYKYRVPISNRPLNLKFWQKKIRIF